MTPEQPSTTDGSVLTVRDVAVRLALSERTIYRYLDENLFVGAFRTEGSWRIPQESVDRYIRERTPTP